jgi:tetratricopeptide (TPR) repeat protein
MKKIAFFLLFFCGVLANGQEFDKAFEQANDFYQKGQYNNALNNYLSIENKGYGSSELYFNIGNCYYKLNKVAPTIFYYEKSLSVSPSNSAAKTNLNFAKGMLVDDIKPLPKTFLKKISEKYIEHNSYNSWAWFSVFFLFFVVLCFAVYQFFSNPKQKVLFFTLTLCFFGAAIVTTNFAFYTYNQSLNNKEAIIFAKEVAIKSGPSEKAPEVFKLHEGLKVMVVEIIDEWFMIKIADGQKGWMKKDGLKLILAFEE